MEASSLIRGGWRISRPGVVLMAGGTEPSCVLHGMTRCRRGIEAVSAGAGLDVRAQACVGLVVVGASQFCIRFNQAYSGH